MRNILLPVDFSVRSAEATRLARVIASRFDAEIMALHVTPTVIADFGAGMIGLSEDRRAALDEELAALIEGPLKGLRSRHEVVTGDPASQIAAAAHRHQCDLIVMPTHGYGAFRRFLLGSTTAKVLHDTDIPVLTTSHVTPCPENEFKIDAVACAVDLGPRTAHAVGCASSLARAFDARMFLVHVIPSLGESDDEYFEADWNTRAAHDALAKLRAIEVENGVEGIPIVAGGNLSKALARQMNELRADVLVASRGAIKHGLAGRLREHSYSIIRESPVPVLSV